MRLEHDWYDGEVPDNVALGDNVYIDTSYGFDAFHSRVADAMSFGDRSGAYLLASFITGPSARIVIVESAVINGACIVCENRVEIGAHALIGWGTFITDTWPDSSVDCETRTRAVMTASHDRQIPLMSGSPVFIGENAWVGFDCVVMPGVTIGRGAVIGSKSIITSDVPPYAVVVGDPQRIVRYLEPTDLRT